MKQLTLATVGFERYARTTRRAVFLADMNYSLGGLDPTHLEHIVNRLASQATFWPFDSWGHAPKPWRRAARWSSAPVSVWVRRGGQGRRCGSAGAYRPWSFQRLFRVSGARDLARAGIDGPPRIATTL